jgi:redox-sensitive bicupin YhaK (pirin superfamily)
VHSERTPEEMRGGPMSMSGLQTWIALPEAVEDMAPAFSNTGVSALPTANSGGVSLRVIMGEFAGMKAPTPTYSETVYVDAKLEAGARLQLPGSIEERAIYVLSGEMDISGDVFDAHKLLVFKPGDEIVITAKTAAHFVILGGASIGSKRYIWWNFVSSSQEKIEQAKEEWRTGKFDIVPGDEQDFIPLPA